MMARLVRVPHERVVAVDGEPCDGVVFHLRDGDRVSWDGWVDRALPLRARVTIRTEHGHGEAVATSVSTDIRGDQTRVHGIDHWNPS